MFTIRWHGPAWRNRYVNSCQTVKLWTMVSGVSASSLRKSCTDRGARLAIMKTRTLLMSSHFTPGGKYSRENKLRRGFPYEARGIDVSEIRISERFRGSGTGRVPGVGVVIQQ